MRALVAAALLIATSAGAAPAAPAEIRYWGQAQSHLEDLDGVPLVDGDWDGRYRPFVLTRGKLVPLIAPQAHVAPTLDLYSPLSLSPTEVVLAGSDEGKPNFDLFEYDTRAHTLVNLTATPDLDEGSACVGREQRLIAYKTPWGERFARVGATLTPLADGGAPAFEQCLVIDAHTVVGVQQHRVGYTLHRCTVGAESVSCEPAPALDDLVRFTKLIRLTPDSLGVIGLRQDSSVRRAFRMDADLAVLTPIDLHADDTTDVLDYDGAAVRFGRESRYWSSLQPKTAEVVYVTRRIAGHDYAIVAGPRLPRTLAVHAADRWQPFLHPTVAVPKDAAMPREIWVSGADGTRYQAFEFGPISATKVVVWWHGGPNENVSPRFSPYFHALTQLGFRVVAVNYPGSTGRGADYEAGFTDEALTDCIRALWNQLRAEHVDTVISWSVSAGNRLQSLILKLGVPVSALVDQVGIGKSSLVEEAAAADVPLFTIRGRNDPYTPIPRIDFAYDGGHDLTMPQHFSALLERITPFLRGAPVVKQ